MFINQIIIAVVFRVINFGILIFLAFFVFKKYVMPLVTTVMNKANADKEYLLGQKLALEKKQDELNDLIQKDALLRENLKLKVSQWKVVVQHNLIAHKQDQARIQQAINSNNNNKVVLREQSRIQRIVLQSVVVDLFHSLSNHFEGSDAGDEYNKKIFQFMGERKS